ncbi:MAG: tRNA pseudouridine(38-40) synthase TruA [Peptococcaceae bacterium]|nr:tRNA pseudouridine(38-40) synthase TruA [Peptococcaceae bacterium]
MRNIKLTIAYDGTRYHGFQKQSGSGLPTIQATLEQYLTILAKDAVKVIGAGRTDAGVHARAQVVSFFLPARGIPTAKIVPALQGLLPGDIAAVAAEEVDQSFHARYSAVAKTYSYTIYHAPVPSPFWRLYSLYVPHHLSIDAMRRAARCLVGEHDFSSFQNTGRPVASATRTLFRADVEEDPPLVRLVFKGNGFLYQMVRIMTGTLLEIGRGKLLPEEMETIIKARDRRAAGPTAPAHGLCLEKVEY